MNTRPHIIFTWLTVAALADWLITRTLARATIFMPKSQIMVQIYSALGNAGQLMTSLTSLLCLIAVGWIAWYHLRWQRNLLISTVSILLILLNLLSLFFLTAGGITLAFQALLCTVILVLLIQIWKSSSQPIEKIAISGVGLTLLIGRIYQSLDSAYLVLSLPGPPVLSGFLFNVGELMVLVSIVALWWAYGRHARGYVYLAAALPALVFAIPRLLAPTMTGVMTIWSTGLTLYLPWPAYLIALWLAGVVILNTLQHGHPAGMAILLLAAGGFAPQMSIQAFLGFIAMWLLVNSAGCVPYPLAQTGLQQAPRASQPIG
jgi:hypothetical protein